MSILSCAVCSGPLATSRKKYCSEQCSNRGKWINRKANSTPDQMNAESRARYARRRIAADKQLRVVTYGCSVDGCEREHTAKGFCLRHWKADKRQSGADWAVSGSDFKRRAIQYGVEYVRFDKREVFARDGWICQLCNLPVDRDAKFPQPDSPSIDHIVPISRGGAHVPENTQCTHLQCNMRKSSKLEVSSGTQDARIPH